MALTQVSEVLALKIELCAVKMREARAAWDALDRDQAQLLAEARRRTGAPADHVYNVATRRFQAPEVAR